MAFPISVESSFFFQLFRPNILVSSLTPFFSWPAFNLLKKKNPIASYHICCHFCFLANILLPWLQTPESFFLLFLPLLIHAILITEAAENFKNIFFKYISVLKNSDNERNKHLQSSAKAYRALGGLALCMCPGWISPTFTSSNHTGLQLVLEH